MQIAPPNFDYFGELRVPQRNAGIVQIGQEVLIKFAGYPYQEYGVVRGRITTFADMSLNNSVFLAKVTLLDGLKTTYGRRISYKTGLIALAKIITDDSRLLMKLFYQLRKGANGR
ncbi:hypothetical protein [Spirosoma foliorum]|uniref:hypothetical protein n=1 Tax=Spirosoma foliorum TaxID=2710596 RepID=UPI001F0AF632|nr:hypothetical protein [Spirosoma foliorum]